MIKTADSGPRSPNSVVLATGLTAFRGGIVAWLFVACAIWYAAGFSRGPWRWRLPQHFLLCLHVKLWLR
jgi:hypothetical protein